LRGSEQAPCRPAAAPRFRAVLLGLALVPALCWWSMRTEIISGGSELIEASLLVIVVFVLFVLVLLNDLVRRHWPGAALTPVELILVYAMQTTSVGLAGLGQMQFLNQALAGAFMPGSDWSAFHPYIARWWVPDPAVLGDYYKGDSTFFTAAHVRGWIVPILAWSVFMLLMLSCFLCLNTMLRRQWVEHERLTFPLVALPLELTQEGVARRLLAHRGFWLALGLTFWFRSTSALHQIVPGFPELMDFSQQGQLISLGPYFTEPPWNAIGFFSLSFHPMILGITYFVPLDVSFSAWFFYLLVKAENIGAAALGFRDPGASPSVALIPYTGEQGAGAFLAVALFALWGARRHLRDVFAKAFGRAPGVVDADEPLSYRTAVFGFLASSAGLVLFTALGGLAWHRAALFLALYLLMITACTRFRAEAGPMLGYGPDFNPHRMMVLLPGSQAWDARNLTPFAYLQWFDSDYRTVAMPQQMEALKMAEAQERRGVPTSGGAGEGSGRSDSPSSCPPRARSLSRSPARAATPARLIARWILIAAALAAVASFVSVLALYYHYGAMTPRGDNGWRLANGRLPFRRLAEWIGNPTLADTTRLQWVGIGFAAATALIRARFLFLWWPFHVSGFALAQAGAAMPWVWFPILMGWSLKAVVLRFGGMRLFRQGVPVAMGFILGDIVVACLWSILGVVLDMDMYMFFPG
jgi:Family of unknown function (DUF6785)/Domain of unknown function (DUF6784)